MKQYILKHTLLLIAVLTSVQSFGVYAAEVCSLTATIPDPLRSYGANVEKLIQAIEEKTKTTTCPAPGVGQEVASIVMQAQSVRGLISSMQGVGSDFKDMGTDIEALFDSFSTRPAVTQSHEKYINDLSLKLLGLSRVVGGRCAQNQIFTETVALQGSLYDTQSRYVSTILQDLYKQNNQVNIYLKTLLAGIVDRSYENESSFTIAPAGFALEMKQIYTSEVIQKCLDEEPKNQVTWDTIKQAFTTGWKFPQAFEVWKEAFQLLIYRGKQVVTFGKSSVDPQKEAQIQALVAQQKGGISDSQITLNSQLFSEFRAQYNRGTLLETLGESAKRIAYQTIGDTFNLETIAEVFESNKKDGRAALVEYAQYDEKAKSLAELDKSLYDAYARRKILVGQNSSQDPKTVAGIVKSISIVQNMRKINEENVKIACENMAKQGQNIDKPKCIDFLKDQ